MVLIKRPPCLFATGVIAGHWQVFEIKRTIYNNHTVLDEP